MTNYERIKEMSAEEMAKILSNGNECERYCVFTKNGKCISFGDLNECKKRR